MLELDFIDEPIYYHGLPPLRIGTDCSGIEAPIQALEQLGIPFVHQWSSDIDKYCIQSIKANYKPKILFGDPEGPYTDGDIRNRDHSTLPNIDLYVCGFPCQPFSNAGKREGLQDKRGNVFWSCIEVIRIKKPTYFILENVRGLIHHDKGNTWKVVWNEIKSLENIGYKVQWKILNTRHFGIPQNRERVYIVGKFNEDFTWPKKTQLDDLRDYVDWNYKISDAMRPSLIKNNYMNNIPNNALFIDLGFTGYTTFPKSDKFTPCIAKDTRLWCVPLHRFATNKERFALQGFKPLNQVVSDTQLRYQIGNSMSVNVLKVLYSNLLS